MIVAAHTKSCPPIFPEHNGPSAGSDQMSESESTHILHLRLSTVGMDLTTVNDVTDAAGQCSGCPQDTADFIFSAECVVPVV